MTPMYLAQTMYQTALEFHRANPTPENLEEVNTRFLELHHVWLDHNWKHANA